MQLKLPRLGKGFALAQTPGLMTTTVVVSSELKFAFWSWAASGFDKPGSDDLRVRI